MNAAAPAAKISTTDRSSKEPPNRATTAMAVLGALVRSVDLISPALGSRAAARLFLTPRRPRMPQRERTWLAHAREETFAAGRFRLVGHRWNSSGEPILLVHGWEGRGSQLGALALALAERGFEPITIDLPAHGASGGGQTNLLEFAESVKAMVERLGGVAGVVAHSFGAAATTVALRHPLPVGRVVYLAPSEDFERYPKLFGQWLRLSRPLSDRMQASVERKLGATMAELRGAALAPSMRAPLLVIHDEDDADVPWKDGKTYSDLWPGARLLTTRGHGHRRILREAEVVGEVARFFAEGSPGKDEGEAPRRKPR